MKVKETDSEEEVQGVDSRDKMIHIENSEFMIFKQEQVVHLVVEQDFASMEIDVRENASYMKSFAVDKQLLVAAAPKP